METQKGATPKPCYFLNKKILFDFRTNKEKDSDSFSDSIIKTENQKIKEDTKNGIVREYSSNETNQIFETNLNNYHIIYDKTYHTHNSTYEQV